MFQVSDLHSCKSADSSKACSQHTASARATCASVSESFPPSDGNMALSPAVCPDVLKLKLIFVPRLGLWSVTEPHPLVFHPEPSSSLSHWAEPISQNIGSTVTAALACHELKEI